MAGFTDGPDRERAPLPDEDMDLGVLRAAYTRESGLTSLKVSAGLACERHGCTNPIGGLLFSAYAEHHALMVGRVQTINDMKDSLYPKDSFQLHKLAGGISDDDTRIAVAYAITTKNAADPRYVIPLSTSKKWVGPQYMAVRPFYDDAAALLSREPVGLLTVMDRQRDGLVESRDYFLINNEVLKRELAVLDWTSRYVEEMRSREILQGTSFLPSRCLLGDAVLRCAMREVQRDSTFTLSGAELAPTRIPSSIRAISVDRQGLHHLIPDMDDASYRCRVSLYVLDLSRRTRGSLIGLSEGVREIVDVNVNLTYNEQSQLLRVDGNGLSQ